MLHLVLHYGLKKCTLLTMTLYCCYESQWCFSLILAERLAVPTSSKNAFFGEEEIFWALGLSSSDNISLILWSEGTGDKGFLLGGAVFVAIH